MLRSLPYMILLLLWGGSGKLFSQTLLHYWNFNNSADLNALTTPSYTLGGAALTVVDGATSTVQITSNTGQNFDVLNENARNSDVAGTHLRYNNSVDGTLIFTLPTTGYKDVVFKYTTRRSSAGNGAEMQIVAYSTDGSSFTNFDTITTDFNGPVLQTFDFSAVAAADNNANFKIRITFLQGAGGVTGNNRFDNVTLDGALMDPTLIHYWNFNNSTDLNALTTPSYTIGGAALNVVDGATSTVQITSNTGQNFDVLNENARNSDVAGTHLRYNNSVDGTLIFALPTTGYEDLLFKYTTRRSSAGNGAEMQIIAYSTDGSSYTNFDTITTDFNGPVLQTFDFSGIDATDDNANFKIRITFLQGAGGVTGNNRFDNVTADAYPTGAASDVTPPAVTFAPLDQASNVAVSVQPTLTFNEDIRLTNDNNIDNDNVDGLVELRLDNASGALVPFDATVSDRVITLVPSTALQHAQTYYVALKANVVEDANGNVISSVSSSQFTTIAPQTIFQPGDLVPVAYRMNATSTEDEMALLTLVDILPGTILYLTDAKFTTNPQPQCSGGITWTAPSQGVAAGTVISIQNDVPSASTGSVTGSGFGLSSSGDQVIVYTGSAASPSYVTALSSNAWVASNSSCSGSNSMLPSTLVDGTSSINLSAANGNVAGNTVNAYYNGPQTGTPSELRTAILDPANWLGTTNGTAAQTWPAWSFPGPPSVVSVLVTSSTSIRLVFNNDLDNASATNLANYTGIAGLSTVTRTINGALADTLVLTYSAPFVNGNSYTLQVSGVQDAEARVMTGTYSFNFTYNTTVKFDVEFLSVNEAAGSAQVGLTLSNPSAASVDLVVKTAPFSTADASDISLSTQTLSFTGSSAVQQVLTVPLVDDNSEEQTEYLVLSLENPIGCSITGSTFFTLFITDDDREAPEPSRSIELQHVGSFDPNSSTGSTTEIVVHDPASQRLFMTSAVQDRLDIADFSDPANITLVTSVDMSSYGGITSVAVKNGIVAVASPNANEQLNGSVVFFDINGNFQNQVTVGALPDMVTFTPDGTKVLTANEGQPNDAYTVDPEGSVSIIDISGGIAALTQAHVTNADFTAFNASEATLIASGVRKTKASSTLAQDVEPEYITVAANSEKAWVTLQENNAVGEIDLQTKTVTAVWALGTKDLSIPGNGIDASDNNGIVAIANWPLKAFHMPDGVANYSVAGTHYLVTANEGDEKEYAGLNERTTVGNAGVVLDPTAFPNAALLKENHNLGRLRMTNLNGDTDTDGDYDELYVNGSRSFSIFNADTKQRVYDSGDDFEQITAVDAQTATIFNADNESNAFKSRSRAKGPEPEGLTVGEIDGKTYAFIGLERVGGVMVYDITDPQNVTFVDYKNSRSILSYSGDQAPEGIIFISAANSPNGKPYVAVANEISGTVAVFEIQGVVTDVEQPAAQPSSLVLYPNPASGEAIYLNQEVSGDVYDVTGNAVQHVEQSRQISVSGWKKGIYLLKTDLGVTRKFVVE